MGIFQKLKDTVASKKGLLLFLGPAFVASIAYMDPGNIATNIAAGSEFGYMLLWVILWASIIAQIVQYLSAKLGIATGKTLPQMCREQFPQAAFPLWIAAELVVMATDLAEFLGAALGIYLLFQIPLLLAALIAGVIVFAILAVEKMGFRKFEYTMMGFLIAIFVSYLFEIFIAKPDWGAITYHTLIPMVGASSIYLAVAIVGATVMPHVIYLHSALVQPRVREGYSKKKHLAAARWDVFIAMNAAFFVNAAMLIMAAAVFYAAGVKVNGIEDAHTTLHPLLGGIAPTVFAFALLMSGLSSATVGTMAGQVVMEGFIKRKISIFLRRFITMLPAFIIIGFGFDPLSMLILSQVVLSFGIPFALIPLIIFTSDKKIMGKQVNDKKTVAAAWLVAAIIIGLNVLLLYQSLGGKF